VIAVVEAKELRDVQTIGTQDPYCKVKLAKKEYKSRVHDNGGKKATWCANKLSLTLIFGLVVQG